MKRISPISIVALCAANGLIAVAAALLRLTPHDVMRIFWVETGVIGLYTVMKIVLASEIGLVGRTKPYKIVLFGAHYGTFWVFYSQLLSYVGRDHLVPFWLTILALTVYGITHAVTFKFSTWDAGELRSVTSFWWMAVPYGRLVPLHAVLLTLHVGLWFGDIAVSPLILVAAKLLLDVPAHAFEHRWVVPRVGQAIA